MHLTLVSDVKARSGISDGAPVKKEAYVGWTGMASASSLARFNASSASGEIGLETVEIDPQFAGGLGFQEGDIVCEFPNRSSGVYGIWGTDCIFLGDRRLHCLWSEGRNRTSPRS